MSRYEESIRASAATIESLRNLEPSMARAVEIVARCLGGGHKLLIAGNGGSAADAAHFATEFVVRFEQDRQAFPAIALAESSSALTATGNDYSFDEIFARQVKAFAHQGDVLVVFTTSGKSKNILKALDAARAVGIESIAFLGRDGGAARGKATVELVVVSNITARIQEAHKVLLHVLCEAVEPLLPRE
ncbi:MAG: SIS domain-containing protein [Phycisphaeraceae bacterium]|nr:SIS domain-containing protein [Phycisphaeraceae bacterium]